MEVGRITLGQERGLALQGGGRHGGQHGIQFQSEGGRRGLSRTQLLCSTTVALSTEQVMGQGKRVQSRVPRRHRTGVASLWLCAWLEP